MTVNFKTFWNFISNKDISSKTEKIAVVQAQLVNQYSFLIAILFFFNGIRDLFFGISTNLYVFSLIGAISLYFFFFTKVRFKGYFVFLKLLVCCGLVFFYSSSDGFDNGLAWYYLAILVATKFLFNEDKNRLYAVIIYAVTFILFYIENALDFRIFTGMSEKYIITSPKNLRLHTFTQIFLFISFNGYFILKKNKMIEDLYEQKIRAEKIISGMNEKLNKNTKPRLIEDVVKLAVSDDIAFLPMFKQIFPYFQENLTKVNPDLTDDEFKFCALLKLGFTTKDIASYNHVTVRSVQTRKNRLRRSFQISSQENLYVWIERF